MGKSLPSATNLQELARVASARLRSAKSSKPALKSLSSPGAGRSGGERSDQIRRKMESSESPEQRFPLSEVVGDCVKRWFQDTLKEAKAGDAAMQVLVGQMYYSGYGVSCNAQKGKAWIAKASRSRSSAWKVSDKRPGYNASDSDSDEVKEDVK